MVIFEFKQTIGHFYSPSEIGDKARNIQCLPWLCTSSILCLQIRVHRLQPL